MKKYSWKKRLLSILMSTSLLLPTFVHAAPPITEDSVADHWAADTLLYWDSLGLFNKIPDDEFGIDEPISRGAFVHIFNAMISVPEIQKTNGFHRLTVFIAMVYMHYIISEI